MKQGPGLRDLQTYSLVPVSLVGAGPAWLGVPRELPRCHPLPTGAAAAAQAVFHGDVYRLGCHSAVLSKELFVPAPSLVPHPWCVWTPAAHFSRGREPRARSRHRGQGMGLKCDISSFELLVPVLLANTAASPRPSRALTLSPVSHPGEDVYGRTGGEGLDVSSCPSWAPSTFS